jgi:hypothetical protein
MLLVAWREITERIESRAFAVSTLVIVAVVVAAVMVPGLRDGTPTMRVGVTGAASPALGAALRDATADGSSCVATRVRASATCAKERAGSSPEPILP